MSTQLRGLFPVGVTPFDEQGVIDEDSLRRSLEFYIESGANGIAHILGGSEFHTLSDEERSLVVRIVTEVVNHRIPVIIGVAGLSPQHSVGLARYAERCGADVVVSVPYYTQIPMSTPQIQEYYEALGSSINIPIMIQNTPRAPMPAQLLANLLKNVEHVDYVKEETSNPGHMIGTILNLAGDACKGILGGFGGHYILDEYRRGSCGTMPFPDVSDVHAALWNALEDGKEKEARRILYLLLPLYNLQGQFGFGIALCKEILRRRGVISNATMRIPGRTILDDIDHKELSIILTDLQKLFTCYPLKF